MHGRSGFPKVLFNSFCKFYLVGFFFGHPFDTLMYRFLKAFLIESLLDALFMKLHLVGSNWQTCIRVHYCFGADWK